MLFRKNYQKIKESLSTDKIIFLVGPRQVGKTTIMKQLYDELPVGKKLFLNMENREYHEHFTSISSIISIISANGYTSEDRFYLFLDEFHLVDQIDRKLKALYDEHQGNIKIICSGSNNILINTAIKESFAGRKTIFNVFPLDFAEVMIWKFYSSTNTNNQDPNERYRAYINNPLNKNMLQQELEQILIRGTLPEVVLSLQEKKKDVLKEIFDRRLYRDIFGSVKKDSSFVSFMKYIAFGHAQQVNFQELAGFTGVSSHTIRHYMFLLEETFIGFQIKPYFTNKLKELVKAPKFYFLDAGLRNFIINRFEFSPQEYGALFEGFIFSELVKSGKESQDIQWWRTADNEHEVDFILSGEKKIIEAKYTKILTKSDSRGIEKFKESYSDYTSSIITKENFTSLG